MIRLRRSEERGHLNHGWLDTFHSFSFGDYYDPSHMGFRTLRVINEDYVAPGMGFGMHGHRDMEILTYVVSGALAHKDTIDPSGGAKSILPGEVQRMTAGRGIRHSEFNPSTTEAVHLLQIWITPRQAGLEPSYDQKAFDAEGARNRFQALASPDGRDGSLSIEQDASLFRALIEPGRSATLELAPDRHAWFQVIKGTARLGEHTLSPGDAAAASGETRLELVAGDEPVEVLAFDLA